MALPGDPAPPSPGAKTNTSPPQPSDRQSDDTPRAAEETASAQALDAAAKSGDAPAATENNEPQSATYQAIGRGIQFLLAKQNSSGHWPDPIGYPGGITGLCTLALLEHGKKPDDPSLRQAVRHLKSLKPSMTYSTAIQTLVLCAADPQANQERIERNVEWLADQQKRQGKFAGAWGYPQAEGDNSNTGFAVTALFEADQVGIKVNNTVWRRTFDYWTKNQNADGSWGYKPLIGGTGSMTSQGMFCVAAAAKVLGEDMPDQPAAQSIAKAAAWLEANYDIERNPGSRGGLGWRFYYLLALGKAGRITGRSKFGDHDWLDEGVKSLLDRQKPDGSWGGSGHAEDDPHLSTSMALLFLHLGKEH